MGWDEMMARAAEPPKPTPSTKLTMDGRWTQLARKSDGEEAPQLAFCRWRESPGGPGLDGEGGATGLFAPPKCLTMNIYLRAGRTKAKVNVA
jgi:hypothetical protein